MKFLFLFVILSFSIYGADSYSNSKLRTPIGSYSKSIGGISILTDAESYFNNPSITTNRKKVGISVSSLSRLR